MGVEKDDNYRLQSSLVSAKALMILKTQV